MRRRWSTDGARVLVGLVAAVAGTACTQSAEPAAAPLQTPSALVSQPSAPTDAGEARALRPPTAASRLYVDVSTGVRGFVGTGHPPPLAVLQQRIFDAIGDAAVELPKQTCAVGTVRWIACTKLDDGGEVCVPRHRGPVVCSDKIAIGKADTFAAQGSRAEAVLVPRPPPLAQNPNHPDPLDWLDDVGLSVMVTGGFDGGALPTDAAETAATACKAGPNPSCVARALAERIAAGYGVWLVTVTLPFDGPVFSDELPDARYAQRAADHLKAIQLAAAGETVTFAGVEFGAGRPVAAVDYPDNAVRSSFPYHGVRPLLVWAFTRDAAQGRSFARALSARLRAEPALRVGKMSPEDVVSPAIEIAPLAVPAYRVASIAPAPDQSDFSPVAQGEFHFKGASADAQGARADVACGAAGRGWLLARYETVATAETPSPYFRWTEGLAAPTGPQGAALADNVALWQPVAGQAAFRLGVNCGPLAVRDDPYGVEFALRSSVDLDSKAVDAAPWSALSAPDTYTMPERVYALRDVLLSALRRKITHDVSSSYARVVVTRSE